MRKSEGLSKSSGQGERESRLELWYAFLIVGLDLVGVTPLIATIEGRINSLRGRIGSLQERIEGEITADTLPDD